MTKKQGTSEEYILSEEQLNILWSKCQELPDKFLVGLMVFCGLRVGEAVHTKASWLKGNEIHIPSTMPCSCWGCRKRGYWKPKSEAGVRVVPIPTFVTDLVYDFLVKYPEGLGITRQDAWYRVKQLAKKAGIRNLFPHALRATYATMLAERGMEAMAICYTLGWSRLEVAQSYIRTARARALAAKQIKEIWG